jgi:hypothetical protein
MSNPHHVANALTDKSRSLAAMMLGPDTNEGILGKPLFCTPQILSKPLASSWQLFTSGGVDPIDAESADVLKKFFRVLLGSLHSMQSLMP